ncbi:MAG: DUF4349 domain-containing protein [Leptolyngbyaceae cyanobacterium]
MRIYYQIFINHVAWLVGAVSLAALVSCGSAPLDTAESASESLLSPAADTVASPSNAAGEPNTSTAEGTQPRPQLIKNASLQVELADVNTALQSISTILKQHQGDLLELSDQDNSANAPRQVLVKLRVPQASLEAVLQDLQALGTVQEQSITAEDVSTQLVDLQARLRNLRKSEEVLLGIMERSGEIADVLEVTRELSTVRESIERADAHFKNLQSQVAYSTVSLTLISTTQPTPTAAPISETLSSTWQAASTSMRAVSVGLLQILMWLLVYSPYIGILLLMGWVGHRYWHRQRTS